MDENSPEMRDAIKRQKISMDAYVRALLAKYNLWRHLFSKLNCEVTVILKPKEEIKGTLISIAPHEKLIEIEADEGKVYYFNLKKILGVKVENFNKKLAEEKSIGRYR